jgi:deazaflavin-dependent oxidoreductase (nitroreductase family)
MKIPNQVRFINKRFTNPIMMIFAGRRNSFLALISHTGRKSGSYFHTPVLTAPIEGAFVFALTYGTHVDWYKNVLASQQAELRYHGSNYSLEGPVTISAETGQKAFACPWRMILRWVGIQDYFRMSIPKG